MRKWLLRGLVFLGLAFALYAAGAFTEGRPSCHDATGCASGSGLLVPILIASLLAWLGCWMLALLAFIRSRWPTLFQSK